MKRKKPTNKTLTCSCCKKTPVYAKGLCKNCYEINRRKGTPEKYRSPILGKEFNGFVVECFIDSHKALIRCKKCGETRIVSKTHFYGSNLRYSPRRCHCTYVFNEEVLTPTQKKYIKVFKENDYSINETAEALGVSKQCVSEIIRKAEKNS